MCKSCSKTVAFRFISVVFLHRPLVGQIASWVKLGGFTQITRKFYEHYPLSFSLKSLLLTINLYPFSTRLTTITAFYKSNKLLKEVYL
jgi:hypothetical protein